MFAIPRGTRVAMAMHVSTCLAGGAAERLSNLGELHVVMQFDEYLDVGIRSFVLTRERSGIERIQPKT